MRASTDTLVTNDPPIRASVQPKLPSIATLAKQREFVRPTGGCEPRTRSSCPPTVLHVRSSVAVLSHRGGEEAFAVDLFRSQIGANCQIVDLELDEG